MSTQTEEKGIGIGIKPVVVMKIEVTEVLPVKKEVDSQAKLAKDNVDIMLCYVEPWNPLLERIYGEMVM